MTAQEALRNGQLREAIELQSQAVRDQPQLWSARLFLVELFILAGVFRSAWDELAQIEHPNPDWPASQREFRTIIRSANRRERALRPNHTQPLAHHARLRHQAIRALAAEQWERAIELIDRADLRSPHLVGHIDGREFSAMRDADDRFASVLEAIVGRDYFWIPFEQLRRVKLAPAKNLLDTSFRPAELLFVNGEQWNVFLPLIYPRSTAEGVDAAFSLGLELDHIENPAGLATCIGSKFLLLGEEELPLAEIQQIEIRPLSGR